MVSTSAGRLRRGQRLDAGEELGKGIGLGEIVVAAGLETANAVIDLTKRRQHQHRRLVAGPAHALDDGKAVALGKHAIDDQDVEATFLGHERPSLAIGRMFGDVPDLGQRLDEIGGRFPVVFDHQNAHVALPRKGGR